MKITDLQMINVMGLKGHRTYVPGKVNILCADNGKGKTSFENAVRYILCGQAPKNLITEGCAYAAVQMKTEDGITYMRQKFSDPKKASKLFVTKDGKKVPVTQTSMAQMIAGGIGAEAVRWSVNGDVLSSFDQKKFGEFLFSYIPEELTPDQVYAMIPDLTDQMKAIVKGIIGDKEFLGIDDITKIYNWCYDYRPKLKSRIAKAEGMISAYSDTQSTQEDAQKAMQALKKMEAELASLSAYEQALKMWQESTARREKAMAQVREMEEALFPLKDVPDEKAVAKAIEKADGKLNAAADEKAQAADSLSKAQAVFDELSKSIWHLKENNGICPYSRHLAALGDDARIKCATDMSPYIESLETACREIGSIKKDAEKTLKKKEAAYEKAVEARDSAYKAKQSLESKLFYEKNLASLKENLPAEVKKPDPPARTKEQITAQMEKARAVVFSFENREKYAKAAEDKARTEEYLRNVESLIKATSPKGAVKTAIFENYVQAFEENINKMAKSISEDMSVKFVTEEGKGINILFSPHGDGYREYAFLSGGEKAMLIYLVLDMINSLTGLRILLVDEMSVLDDNVLEELIKVLAEHQDDYDHVFIALAHRKGIEEMAGKYGAKLIIP